MTDKVQKIREEVEKRYEYWKEKESNSHSIESEIRMSECKHLLLMLDSLQEEPVSEDRKEAILKKAHELAKKAEPISGKIPKSTLISVAIDMAEWCDSHSIEEHVSEELEGAAFAFLNIAMKRSAKTGEGTSLVFAFKAGAQWQKEQFEKNRLKHCNSITNEQAELEQGFIDQHLDKHQRMPTFLDAIEYGMRLQKEQIEEVLLSEVLPCFMHGGEADEVVAKLDEVLNQKK